jgi:hypothetical protein
VLTGSTAANILTGGAGNDTISGGAGTDIAKVAGLKASYTLQTAGGQVQLVDNDSVTDGNDGTDTLVGIETVQFKDQSMGIVSPIILDLHGTGIRTVSASNSGAAFDMDGDGRADDTSWIGSGNGFLFLDRDGNGTMSGIGEMSFTADAEGAETDLAGLGAFDSNGDGKLSSADARFGDFGVWRDANGNGAVEAGEILSLADIGLVELSLTAVATHSSVALDEVAVVNSATWTTTGGETRAVADAMMTYVPASTHAIVPSPVTVGGTRKLPGVPVMRPVDITDGKRMAPVMRPIAVDGSDVADGKKAVLVMRPLDADAEAVAADEVPAGHQRGTLRGILEQLRRENLLGEGLSPRLFEDVQAASDDGNPIAAQAGSLGAAKHNPVASIEPLGGIEVERQLQAIAQDLAAFGAQSSSGIELQDWRKEDSVTLFAA